MVAQRMKHWYDLDRKIIAKLQGFTNWTQRTLGLRVSQWNFLFLIGAGESAFRMRHWVLLSLTAIDFWLYHRSYHKRQPTDILDWNASMSTRRLICLLLSLCSSVLDWGSPDYWMAFFMAYIYFRELSELPPSKSTVRQWLGNTFSVRTSATPATQGNL